MQIGQHIANTLQVISPTALKFVGGVETLIAQGTSCTLICLELDVIPCFWIKVSLGQTKVNNVDKMLFLADTYQKVLGLNVSMNETFTVQVFSSTDALDCKKC